MRPETLQIIIWKQTNPLKGETPSVNASAYIVQRSTHTGAAVRGCLSPHRAAWRWTLMLVWSHLWVAEITVCYYWWPQQVCSAAIGSDLPQWIKPAGGCSTCTDLTAELGPAHHGKCFCTTKTDKLYLYCTFHSTYIHTDKNKPKPTPVN